MVNVAAKYLRLMRRDDGLPTTVVDAAIFHLWIITFAGIMAMVGFLTVTVVVTWYAQTQPYPNPLPWMEEASQIWGKRATLAAYVALAAGILAGVLTSYRESEIKKQKKTATAEPHIKGD